MIPPEERFQVDSKWYCGTDDDPRSTSVSNIWDFDQLRMIKVTGFLSNLPSMEEVECSVLAQFADYLSPEVRVVELDRDGLICGVSLDLEEDERFLVPYPPFSIVMKSLAGCHQIKHSQLQELDRIARCVDLTSYEDENQNTRTVVFKFNLPNNPFKLQRVWSEIHLLSCLPPHPNLVPFDGIVLEDVESRMIGFTMKYIPGLSFADPKLPFRFEWLQQLTQVVDFLNLNLGIMHQDIEPRHLLIDPDTQKLLLIDFDAAACGMKGLYEEREDVTSVVFTVYEIITNDSHYAPMYRYDRHADMVQNLPEWTPNRELDADVSVFRKFLSDWVKKRQSDGIMEQYLNAPNRPSWPDEVPTAHDYDVPFDAGIICPDGTRTQRTGARKVRTAKELGQFCLEWQRPSQSRMTKKAWNGDDEKLRNEGSQQATPVD